MVQDGVRPLSNAPRKASEGGKGQPLSRSFACAWQGVKAAFGERNMRIHLCFAIAAVILGFALRIDAPSWLAVILCICLVFSLEILNTALEALVDLVSPGYHELAKRAKDCAAGAVLVCAIGSLAVAAIVFIPALYRLAGTLTG